MVNCIHAPCNKCKGSKGKNANADFIGIDLDKLDKVKKSQILGNLEVIREDLELPEECPLIPFSAEKGNGRDELIKLILQAAGE